MDNKGDDIFYTGLKNGKLTEWQIIPFLSLNNKTKSKTNYLFDVKEKKSIYAHESPITTIEIDYNQNILITSGEDKFIYIRKIFDFELLTVINLIYSFGNPLISTTCNIFPSLIKVSDLNLLYVLLYDYDNEKTYIRGYNLNGLFFAQTDPLLFKNGNDYLLFNNISFTKNSNLIVGFYNLNKFYILSCSNLSPLWIKEIGIEEGRKKSIDKIKKKTNDDEIGTQMVEYNYSNGEFYILYDNKYIAMTLKEKNEIKEFTSF